MKETKLSSGIIFLSGTALACAVLFTIFTNCNDSSGKLNKNESDVAAKIDAAVSCSPNGLTVADRER